MVRCAILPKAPLPVVWFDGRAGHRTDAHLSDDFARIRIDDQQCFTAAVCCVHPPALRIDCDVIEAAKYGNGLRWKRRNQHEARV